MQELYPLVLNCDVMFCSTGVNQSAMSSRLKLFADRLISLDGGFFVAPAQYREKDADWRDRCIALSTKLGKVCWTFKSLSGFSNPTFAHIHLGAAKTSGNIVLPLSTGTTLLTKGCVPASATLINAIAANPHAYYVNIHSKQYPGGAVRAQL